MPRRGFHRGVALLALIAIAAVCEAQPGDRTRLDRIEQSLKGDVPRVLCLDARFATGGQPLDGAYAKAAASGFHSVLSLRTAEEGVDLARERALVERAGMRYVNIPVVSRAPRAEQADEFIRVARQAANQPMLVTCASANRVGAFMMIYRVLEQGWSEDQALDEAVRIGLTGEELRTFAHAYIAQHRGPR